VGSIHKSAMNKQCKQVSSHNGLETQTQEQIRDTRRTRITIFIVVVMWCACLYYKFKLEMSMIKELELCKRFHVPDWLLSRKSISYK